jgi:preprotein translocase subunit SecY
VSVLGGGFDSGAGDKGLKLSLIETLKRAWADPDLRSRILFVLGMFAVYVLGVHVPVPIPGMNSDKIAELLANNPFFGMMDVFGGGALRRVSVFALGLNPYITASIIMQILTTAFPQWKKEMQEGGEYARRQQNKRTRLFTLVLCVGQGLGFIQIMAQSGIIFTPFIKFTTLLFWTAGAMFVLWLGEQISERGIGNGVSLMIFAGIVISMPNQIQIIGRQIMVDHVMSWWQAGVLIALFLGTTWFIVMFTSAQRRLPIQHMRRQVGTKVMGGQTSYLPIPVNTAGVIPIIFAVSLVFLPMQFQQWFPVNSSPHYYLGKLADYMNPGSPWPEGLVGMLAYTVLIFFFTYFYTAIQYNVEDLSNNLKKHGSFIPGVRPGKQTKDFLDAVISKITVAGALFLTIIALMQYITPAIAQMNSANAARLIGGTSLLIMVSVALETMRQIEANILMRQYGS